MSRRSGGHVFYRFCSGLFLTAFRLLRVDIRAVGYGNIPERGPAVLASNHISYLDFAFVALAPPRPRRPVRFLARREFFDLPVVGFLLRKLGQIPVDVHGDARSAADAALETLSGGEVVGLHPEGTISPSFVPRRAKSGAIRLAEATQAPIIPVAIWGSQRLLTKGRPIRPHRGATVVVRYGEPFVPSGRTAMARSAELMARIEELLGEVQRTYPQLPGPAPHDWWMPAHLGGSAPTPEEAEAHIAEQNEQRRRLRDDAPTPTATRPARRRARQRR